MIEAQIVQELQLRLLITETKEILAVVSKARKSVSNQMKYQ